MGSPGIIDLMEEKKDKKRGIEVLEQDTKEPKHDSGQYATGLLAISHVIDNAKSISNRDELAVQSLIVSQEYENLMKEHCVLERQQSQKIIAMLEESNESSAAEVEAERKKLQVMQEKFEKERVKFAEKQKLAQQELNSVLEQIKQKEESINKKRDDIKH